MAFRKLLVVLLMVVSPLCWGMPEFIIEIQNHLFSPQQITIPANQKVKITFINHDATPEEIDSFDLNREKVVFGNSRASIYVGPLPTGHYDYFGEFHPNSAIGRVVVSSEKGEQNVN